MLNFSKIKVLSIYLIFIILSFFSLLNLQNNNNLIINKKINLGLDLQGGSYLLLEIDTKPLIRERIQDKVIPIKKFLNENNIIYTNFFVDSNSLQFKIDQKNLDKFELRFYSKKDNLINPFITQYNNHELLFVENNEKIKINFSKFGLLSLNNSALKQSIEIVRRRIDDTGTKEPTILQRGEKRILVELPGLKDPERIKNLLGKTAQLSFRLVSNNDDDFGNDVLLSEDGEDLSVSKKIILSGENLIDSQPRLDTQSNQPIVSFTLDRLGAQKFGRVTTSSIGQRLAIILDNKIISAPSIREPITGGRGTISGNFTFQEATDLAL